ncbi:hypothetical protein [Gymnodinialimonas ceratoperidinii]|uniref:Uncharacterized protein n=1 Tax=Gymnodinialimonas ceratoperidinii TaxID=2856823 RepID=A0A8F6Y9C4_9RHOB|nr:hypothetical protein [Gymnodinialimonas ceratoperidinii]QXT38423.1 hypothetical protein KYE46_10730 [Gymnodinialimonas ceratoperidinii]
MVQTNSENLARVVYIAGQGHSGTTLLDLACSSGGISVSLGELQISLGLEAADVTSQICSCGAPTLECTLWGPYFSGIEGLDRNERFKRIMEAASELVGPEGLVVDSSKTIAGLRRVAPLDPFVLHTSKDMRAYISAQLKRADRIGKRRPRAIDEGISWWRQNGRIRDAIQELNLSSLTTTYEEICLATQTAADRINAFVGAQLVDAENVLSSQNHHIISGNGMRTSHGGKLRYDYRWMRESDWLLPYMVLRSARKQNEQRYKT